MAGNGRRKTQVLQHDPLADLDAGPEAPAAADAAAPPAEALALGASLCIADVAELHQRLRTALDLGALHLDGGELEQVDGAGVQLLCAAVRDARRLGHPVTWTAVAPRLRAAVERLGLGGEFGWQ